MKLFLDSSVLLAASGSERGASREVIRRASEFNRLLEKLGLRLMQEIPR